MFALSNINSGDVIFREKPLVSSQFSWNKTYKYLCCDNCLRPLETAEMNLRRLAGDQTINLPFPECCTTAKRIQEVVACPHCQVQYCCDDCRVEAAQKYHFALCQKDKAANIEQPLNALIDSWKKIHYPPETTTIELIVKILGMYIQADDKNQLMNHLKDFQSKVVNEDLMIAHKMLGPNFENQLSELYPIYCRAFGDNGDLKEFLTPQAFKTFFAIIGTNGQGIGTSPFANWVKNVSDLKLSDDERIAVESLIDDLYQKLDEVTGLQFLNNEGSALYVTQSKINHSCVPNSVITFPSSDHTLALMALTDIKAGDEITISYLDECSVDRSRHSRQKELTENYLFVCRCAKCEEQINDPDVTSDEDEEEMEEDDD
ncbi:hypothetical protein HA402_009735 [Bradysia odoriphaga]|nr:hypothetical protein HA402_009735 [Bradysia odoriphaga]